MDRDAVVAAFQGHYVGTETTAGAANWTGSFSTCDAGGISAEFQADVIARINYFRAMAGVPADIELSPAMDAAAQQAAFMIAANGQLSHNPPSTWACYDASGVPAASGGNLSIGINTENFGPVAVTSQMRDSGANNIGLGHRRWLLFSRAGYFFGSGNIPPTPRPTNANELVSASVFWVIDEERPLPANQGAIAWPPSGFVPAPVVFPRWSFALPDRTANFANATVSMTDSAGTPIPLTVIHRATGSGVGDPTIAWEPAIDPSALSGDTTFEVQISGIAGATATSAEYTVTIIDPFVITPLKLTGPATAYIDRDNHYSFTPFANAEGHEFRHAQIRAGTWTEGAESGQTQVIDETNPSNSLITPAVRRSGGRCFHLNLDDGDLDQHFELDRGIIPSASSHLEFYHAFRYVGTGMRLIVEVLPEGGDWKSIWERAGRCGASCNSLSWDSAWQATSVSLAAYADQIISIRFRYVYDDGFQWWPYLAGDNPLEFGAYIDDISVTSSEELANPITSAVAADANTLTFVPEGEGDYRLQIRAIVSGQAFAYGPALPVSAIQPPAVPSIASITIDATGATCISVADINPAFIGEYQLQTSSSLTPGSWTSLSSTPQHRVGSSLYDFCLTVPTGEIRQFFRIAYPVDWSPSFEE